MQGIAPRAGRHLTYRDLAEHYAIAVLPAPARRLKWGELPHRGIARVVQKGLCLKYAVLAVFFGGVLNDTEI